ncbi:S8 family serine peptidase [Paenibacillus puerhi]|uniref:S8 family serine peptidase n=1 Tax=Paenibacillus puerhi TaxID=2692622 RepID=UPI0038B23133
MLVAVFDTGVNYNDSYFENLLVTGKNIIDPKSSYKENIGHGTQVAGVIADQIKKIT